MFAGDFTAAGALFEESQRLSRAEGRDLAALMCEVCVCQAMTYAGDAAGARHAAGGVVARAARSRNPSAIAWAELCTVRRRRRSTCGPRSPPTGLLWSSRGRSTIGCSSGWP